ncbi:uncharacterized protein LOC101863459 [Aplysia californica]|uniref:Uncharacterized protein LOC101863459 n=1 Tax=Aplysia californica TaxID=6500 RepID=A0ABM0K002_APLCA|nr:uncharacterized protein LOC101863459 [Aplysia californica]XP_035827520.1 uncharacterized protein LOC101863459 [Aplysia californica]XP_035827521.1 uncharacterized protein LOC101863459 [Aplysia californica]
MINDSFPLFVDDRNGTLAVNASAMAAHARRFSAELWIPYVMIGVSCVTFLAVHFYCYHKRNRERYLRKREEKRVKSGLMERRRITTLMVARYQSELGIGKSESDQPVTEDTEASLFYENCDEVFLDDDNGVTGGYHDSGRIDVNGGRGGDGDSGGAAGASAAGATAATFLTNGAPHPVEPIVKRADFVVENGVSDAGKSKLRSPPSYEQCVTDDAREDTRNVFDSEFQRSYRERQKEQQGEQHHNGWQGRRDGGPGQQTTTVSVQRSDDWGDYNSVAQNAWYNRSPEAGSYSGLSAMTAFPIDPLTASPRTVIHNHRLKEAAQNARYNQGHTFGERGKDIPGGVGGGVRGGGAAPTTAGGPSRYNSTPSRDSAPPVTLSSQRFKKRKSDGAPVTSIPINGQSSKEEAAPVNFLNLRQQSESPQGAKKNILDAPPLRETRSEELSAYPGVSHIPCGKSHRAAEAWTATNSASDDESFPFAEAGHPYGSIGDGGKSPVHKYPTALSQGKRGGRYTFLNSSEADSSPRLQPVHSGHSSYLSKLQGTDNISLKDNSSMRTESCTDSDNVLLDSIAPLTLAHSVPSQNGTRLCNNNTNGTSQDLQEQLPETEECQRSQNGSLPVQPDVTSASSRKPITISLPDNEKAEPELTESAFFSKPKLPKRNKPGALCRMETFDNSSDNETPTPPTESINSTGLSPETVNSTSRADERTTSNLGEGEDTQDKYDAPLSRDSGVGTSANIPDCASENNSVFAYPDESEAPKEQVSPPHEPDSPSISQGAGPPPPLQTPSLRKLDPELVFKKSKRKVTSK